MQVEIIDPPEHEVVSADEIAERLNEQIRWSTRFSSQKNWTIISAKDAKKPVVREVVRAARKKGYGVDPKYWWSIHTGYIKVWW